MKRLILAVGSLALCHAAAVQATPITYTASLSGANESPANASPGTGFATVVFDDVAHTLSVEVVFSGLLGNTTAAHIHCCTAVPGAGTVGVATQVPTFIGFPLGVTSGTYPTVPPVNVFDTTLPSSWNPAFVSAHGGTLAGAESALGTGLLDGKAYFNIHTTLIPGGEIRGFLTPAAVPEPASFAVMALGMLVVGAEARRKQRH